MAKAKSSNKKSATKSSVKRTAARAAKQAHRTERKLTEKAAEQRDKGAVKVIGTLSEVGDQPPLVALNLVTIAIGVVLRRPAMVRTGVRMLAAHGLATGIKTVIKRSVDRTRPHAVLDGKRERVGKGEVDHHDHNSFPSGHTAGAVAVAAAAARDRPEAAAYAYGTAGAVAAAQVPRAKHYATDVLAGAAIGWLSERLSTAVLNGVERRFTARGSKKNPAKRP